MELINKYDGSVFFVDLLGMGALTKKQIELKDDDYNVWLDDFGLDYNHQYLAASLLAKFRELLISLDTKYTDVTVSQLSDCAFIWSKEIKDVIKFTSEFMHKAIEHGLLCRGGLTYGEIIETNNNHKLGRFIVGQAVTDAVKLEGIPKGARVLIDQDFPSAIWDYNQEFGDKIHPIFAPFTNPLDYEVYDEFKWYLIPYEEIDNENLNLIPENKRIEFTKERLLLANLVKHSPKFNWNSSSKQGLIQVKATLSFLSEDNLLNVSHNFEWNNIEERYKRSNKIVNNVETLILEDTGYKINK